MLNLTGGTGADLTLGGVENPLPLSEEGTDMAGATERMRHVRECLPEIATIDMGTMNFGEGDYIMTNSTSQLDEIARQFQDRQYSPSSSASTPAISGTPRTRRSVACTKARP